MQDQYVLALDQGTTSSRAMLFDHDGNVVSMAQKEFQQIYPQPGWVEHDPQEIWSTQAGVAAEAVTRAGMNGTSIAAIGITNQRETTIVWDRETGHPVYNAIVWQDRRTAEFCDQLKAQGLEEKVRAKTGLPIDSYFSATKIRWILDNVDGAREKARQGRLAFGTVDSWLVWNFTRHELHITDVTNASRTMLFNIHTLQWDDELLDALDIPRSMLPEVRPSSEVYGPTKTTVFASKIPLSGIAGDQHAALFGQMCTEAGMVKNTYGTGCFLVMNTGDTPIESRNNLVTTIAWQIGSEINYALEGSIFIAGAVVQWLRDGLGIIRSAAEIESLARGVPHSDGVYLVPAFAGLGAPHWNARARGTLVRRHARHELEPYRARRARFDRVPVARRAQGDGGRFGYQDRGVARRRRRVREQPADAVPGRHSRRRCRASPGRGNDGARRGLSRGAGGRLLEGCRRIEAAMEARTALHAWDAAGGG